MPPAGAEPLRPVRGQQRWWSAEQKRSLQRLLYMCGCSRVCPLPRGPAGRRRGGTPCHLQQEGGRGSGAFGTGAIELQLSGAEGGWPASSVLSTDVWAGLQAAGSIVQSGLSAAAACLQRAPGRVLGLAVCAGASTSHRREGGRRLLQRPTGSAASNCCRLILIWNAVNWRPECATIQRGGARGRAPSTTANLAPWTGELISVQAAPIPPFLPSFP